MPTKTVLDLLISKAIQDALPEESTNALATRLGISWTVCNTERKRLNPEAANAPHQNAKRNKPARLGQLGNAEQVVPEPAKPVTVQPLANAEVSCATVTVIISEDGLNNWWRWLTLDQKAKIFSNNVEFGFNPEERL